MLTFAQKLEIAGSFAELSRNDVSMGRVNYRYEDSAFDKKTVVYHLHPNGNGYVYGGRLDGADTDDKGYVNIRDYGEADLRELIARAIRSLAPTGAIVGDPAAGAEEGYEELWADEQGHKLTVRFEDDMWYVFAGLNLDGAFGTLEETREYLREEGFRPAKKQA